MPQALIDKVRAGRGVRAMGFDDAPFPKTVGAPVHLAGIVCAGTRFEGMVWGTATRDGTDATEVIGTLLTGSKFLPQLDLVLLDGITVGGLNVVDLPALHQAVGVPCVAVMRRRPDLDAMRHAVSRVDDAEERWASLLRAGDIHERDGFVFQVCGLDPESVAVALSVLTDKGRVPEALRLAHLIGAAVVRGESGRRA